MRNRIAREDIAPIDLLTEGVILALWRQGCDTVEIARQTHLREWQVFNRLLHLREGAR